MTHDSTPASPTGFSIVPNWMMADERVTGNMVLVYAALASYADQTGLAYPGLPALAVRAKMGTTAAREAVRVLERLGVVSVTQRGRQDKGQTSNLYRIAVHERGLNHVPPPPPTPGVGGVPQRLVEGAPTPGVDEQDPLNNTQLPPVVPRGGTPALDGLQEPLPPDSDHFDVFWKSYPRKVGKPQARRAWAKALKDGTHWSVIVGGALAYAEDPNREAAFTKHPSTWLRAEGWNDDPLPERPPAPGTQMLQPALPSGTMSERVTDCSQVGRKHRPMGDGTCMLCEARITG